MKRLNLNQKQKDLCFIGFLLLFSIILFAFNYRSGVSGYNATLLGLTYTDGILPRALIGSIYALMDFVLPFDLYTYGNVLIYTFILTFWFILIWILCHLYLLRKSTEDNRNSIEYLMVFITLFVVGSFTSFYNYGRLDLYMVALSILAVVILVSGRCEWLVIPISVAGVLIHEGYVFMYYNIILVFLIYKLINNYEQQNKKSFNKYLIIFIFSVVLVCLIFGYYTFIYNGNPDAYSDTLSRVTKLSYNGEYHEDVLRAEVLGVNLFAEEWEAYHIGNIIETIFFIILFSPFLIIQVLFFRRIIKNCDSKISKLKYWIFILGALTTLPLFILKVDFGRWILAVLVYYTVVTIGLIAMGDKIVSSAWRNQLDNIRNNISFGKLLLVYAMLFVPLLDVNICNVTGKILELVQRIL